MSRPKEVFYVQVKHSKKRYDLGRPKAGAKGGRVASLEFALTRKAALLRYDPGAEVKIFRSQTEWIEVDDDGTDRT